LSAETFPNALQKFNFLHWFNGRLVSGEEMSPRPFMEIYKTVISRYSLDASKAVFVDDKERNLNPAKELGIKTILFTNQAPSGRN
jgi:2-haloacid dehalogenase